MTIILPRFRKPTDYLLRKVSASRVARSATGGARLPLNRTGDHFALEIQPGVLGAICGRELLVDILRGSGEPLRAYVDQLDLDPGAVGTPRVAGADQWGESLDMDGFTAQLPIRKGWAFTVVRDTLPSLHFVSAEVIADAAGEATVAFWPPLRAATADNALVEMAEPWIQGSVDDGGDHETRGFRDLSLDKFTIEEDG